MERMGISPNQKIAVVGAGVAGVVAAHILQCAHDVTLFEKRDYVGGHTNTITLDDGPDAGLALDTGFIVFNDRTYPTFIKFLRRLGVAYRKSEMSWSLHEESTGFHYSGSSINGLFAQRINLISPPFIWMLRDIIRFNRNARRDLAAGVLAQLTLREYLVRGKYNKAFIQKYLIPMGAAIWSVSPREMFRFPAESFVQFFENHGLLALTNRPQWYTVKGGSQSYVRKFLNGFRGDVRLKSRIKGISRSPEAVHIEHEDGRVEGFDYVVIAAHADQAYGLLKDPNESENCLLTAWEYSDNEIILHTDGSLMPPNRSAWASWNYVQEVRGDWKGAVSLTYYLNRLQGLDTEQNYYVSVNRKKPIPHEKIIQKIDYKHPVFTKKSVATQQYLKLLNGTDRTFYCGSYFGYGFHEDAVKSGVAVAKEFGLEL